MNELVVADRASGWRRLKALVQDSVSSPITKRVYNLGLDEFIAWFSSEPRPAGFTKATVMAWRVALEARGLGPISINVRITAVRKLAVEAADNGLSPDLRNPQSAEGGSRCRAKDCLRFNNNLARLRKSAGPLVASWSGFRCCWGTHRF
jgi:hypothetical protein